MELQKWPRLLMAGETVKPEQAMEILIRTNEWFMLEYHHTVDTVGEYIKKFYIKTLPEEHQISSNAFDSQDLTNKLNTLDLAYLSNARIQSSWIGGLKGWMNWDGKLFANNYNIGKWPSTEEVMSDIETIVMAFPYLDFELQLINKEYDDDSKLVAEYPAFTCQVKNEKIEIIDTNRFITSSNDEDDIGPSTIEDLELLGRALNQVYNKYN